MKNIWAILILCLYFNSCKNESQKKADNLFYSAIDRLKTNPKDIDSLSIKQSISDFSKVISLNTKFWEAYSNRGGLYHNIKDFDKAIADFTTALKYADKNSAINLHDMRAYSYYAIGKYQNAITDWTIAVDNLGDPSYALYQRALAKWKIGQKVNACEDFKKATSLNKNIENSNKIITCE